MTGNLLDVPDLVVLLNKSRKTIWIWTRNGTIPPSAVVMFGRVARYRPEALRQAGFLATETATAPASEPARA